MSALPLPPNDPPRRRRYRAPVGLPQERQARWGTPVSVLVHALILFLLVVPLFAHEPAELVQGAGGAGPAGGGGGGRHGAGGAENIAEHIQYVTPRPTPPPLPAVVVPPKEKVKPPEPTAKTVEPVLDVTLELPKTTIDMALTHGVGGGTGNDGSSGNGPGSGGGVGSGVGTGRGSAAGPGTGGGPGTVYPPTPTQVFLPPIPAPERIKPYRLVATFDVDSTGKVIDVKFNPSSDGSYNRRLNEILHQVRFRPATTWEGVPVRAQAQLVYTIP